MRSRLAFPYLSTGVASMLLLLISSCGIFARESLKSEAGQKSFMESCVSEASKSGDISKEKSTNYCQCSLDELKSDRVSDDDLSTFFKSEGSAEEIPEVIKEILTECAGKTLS